MTIGAIGSGGAAAVAGGAAKPAAAGMFDQILADFKKEAAKTPAERARDTVLKKHNLSEDGYQALPPEQKKAIDAEIAEAAARAMQADKGKGFRNGGPATAS